MSTDAMNGEGSFTSRPYVYHSDPFMSHIIAGVWYSAAEQNVETNLKHNAYYKHITLVCLAKTDEIITTNSLLYNGINPLATKLNVKCNMHKIGI